MILENVDRYAMTEKEINASLKDVTMSNTIQKVSKNMKISFKNN